MDRNQPNSREYQRQAIDFDIKSLEDSIQILNLKYRRNALAPVSSLPTEVIDAIICIMPVVSASTATPGKKVDPLACLRVSHVCHQWREIALNQPLFWSHVNFTALSAAGAAEILARAKMVPLYLEAMVLGSHWGKSRRNTFQEELQVYVSRICHLHISAKVHDLRNIIDSLVSPAPTLESLSLTSERRLLQADVPDTLFGGAMPRLTCLKLRNCNISWKSPLLKGLQILEMRLPSMTVIPGLWAWLDALNEMPQLKMLTLHAASPTIHVFPFDDVLRTATLPSLTHLDITDSPQDCACAIAHLELPALTCLCVQTYSRLDGYDVEGVLPHIAQHVHGQRLQSVLVRFKDRQIDILAWPVPDIDVGPTLYNATPPAYVALSIKTKGWHSFDYYLKFFDAVMADLPLDDLITLVAQDVVSMPFGKFWRYNSRRWPLLRRVRLTPNVATKFTDWLLADDGGCENPLLPSLAELVLVGVWLDEHRTRGLCDALMKRVEQGVPLETLDLRTCRDNSEAVRLLSEIVVDVMGPEETLDARAQIKSTWDRLDQGPFKYDNFEKDPLASDDDDDDDDDDIDDDEEDERFRYWWQTSDDDDDDDEEE